MAKNSEIQEKLYKDLSEVLGSLEQNTEEYYEKVMTQLPYLEAVIKESLRLYPPVIRLDRRVNKEGYKLGGISLQKGTLVQVSFETKNLQIKF